MTRTRCPCALFNRLLAHGSARWRFHTTPELRSPAFKQIFRYSGADSRRSDLQNATMKTIATLFSRQKGSGFDKWHPPDWKTPFRLIRFCGSDVGTPRDFVKSVNELKTTPSIPQKSRISVRHHGGGSDSVNAQSRDVFAGSSFFEREFTTLNGRGFKTATIVPSLPAGSRSLRVFRCPQSESSSNRSVRASGRMWPMHRTSP
jgi:hypothetical protein